MQNPWICKDSLHINFPRTVGFISDIHPRMILFLGAFDRLAGEVSNCPSHTVNVKPTSSPQACLSTCWATQSHWPRGPRASWPWQHFLPMHSAGWKLPTSDKLWVVCSWDNLVACLTVSPNSSCPQLWQCSQVWWCPILAPPFSSHSSLFPHCWFLGSPLK
jgi:hypothetical protein